MTRTAKAKRKKRAVRELRVQSIVIVNAKGVECGRIEAGAKATTLRLHHPGSDFALDLAVYDDHAGLTIDNFKRDSDDRCCVSLQAWGRGPSGNWSESGYGALELHPDQPAGSTTDRQQCGIEFEHAVALRSLTEWTTVQNAPQELTHAMHLLRLVHEKGNREPWEVAQHAIMAAVNTPMRKAVTT